MPEKSTGHRVVRKIGSSHVVWFSETNRWVEFREPAWIVYESLGRQEKETETVARLSGRYGLPADEAVRFYREIAAALEEAAGGLPVIDNPGNGQNKHPGETTPAQASDIRVLPPRPLHHLPPPGRRTRTRHYNANNRTFTITYCSPAVEFLIHRPLAHLETGKGGESRLELVLHEEKGDGGADSNEDGDTGRPPRTWYARVTATGTGNPEHCAFYDAGMLKHKVYNEINNYIHGMRGEEWMCHIHASALTDGHQAVLLPSASGSGKSTMAALLQLPAAITGYQHIDNRETEPGEEESLKLAGYKQTARKPGSRRQVPDEPAPSGPTGYNPATGNPVNLKTAGSRDLCFMSDDFTPVAAGTLMAYPFPAAINIKEGSFRFLSAWYDPAEDADASCSYPVPKTDRFLRPRFPGREPFSPRPVTAMVFLKYGGEEGISIEKMDTLSALEAFHREAWVSQNPAHAGKFIDWFVTVSHYRLVYNDSSRAIEAIRNLFDRTILQPPE